MSETTQNAEKAETRTLFELIWQLTQNFMDGRNAPPDEEGVRQTTIIQPFHRPNRIWGGNNADLTTVDHEIAIASGEFQPGQAYRPLGMLIPHQKPLRGNNPNDKRRMVAVASRTQYPWGHPNTGARIGLPWIPLDKQSPSYQALAEIISRREPFPLEQFTLWQDKTDIGITTRAAHGQFDYAVHNDPRVEGKAGIHLGNSAILRMEDYRAADLEKQLIEGAIQILAELLQQASGETLQLPSAIKDAIQRVQNRLQTTVPEGFQEGGFINRRNLLRPGH